MKNTKRKSTTKYRRMTLPVFSTLLIFGVALVTGCEDPDPDGSKEYKEGLKHYYGIDGEQSFEKANEMFKKSSGYGNSESMLYLGKAYLNGNGVEQSFENAFDWFKLAAEDKNTIAEIILAACYYQGIGVEQSTENGDYWSNRFAAQLKRWEKFNQEDSSSEQTNNDN